MYRLATKWTTKKTKRTAGKHRKCIYRFRLTRLSKRHSSFVAMTQCRKLCDSTARATEVCGLRIVDADPQ